MSAQDLATAFDRYGFPLIFSLGVVYVVVKHIWPFVMKRVEQADADRKRIEEERKEERRQYEEDRRRERDLFVGTLAGFSQQLGNLTNNVSGLTQAIDRMRQRDEKRERP